jgi:thiol-disulfide isomerase/thioredoxin
MNLRIGITMLVLGSALTAEASTIVRVTGQVVDAAGKPVAGARVGGYWISEQGGPLKSERPAVSGADGRFSLEIELFRFDQALMVFDPTGQLGGVATIGIKSPQQPISLKLLPLGRIRTQFTSEKSDVPLSESFLTLLLPPNKLQLGYARSRASTFDLQLPPGRYTLQVEGGGDNHEMDSREVTVEPGKVVDLGEIKLTLSPRARLYGKPAPAWHFADARGVAKSAQPKDFKGKWVALEFWGYWCGPCTGRGLPGWMDFADDHAIDRDKFDIVTVHERNVTDFADLDKKLKPIVARVWRGRPFPFPILLDTSGSMARDYGVRGYPTVVLIDPEGRVVDFGRKPTEFGSQVCEEFLASKLTPLPPSKQLERALDRGQALGVDDEPLAGLMDFYARVSRIAIRIDRDELKAAGLDVNVIVPLRVNGRITLRSWLNLTLDPLGLTYVAEGAGLRIVRRSPGNLRLSQPSQRQEEENALVAAALKKKVTLEFHGESLKQAISMLETKSGDETFLLNPAARISGALSPETKVTGSAVEEPLASALEHLLAPLGMTYVIRDECVILTKSR